MDKQTLLKQIAEMGYNVGYGAKLHFASYDIVEKMPNFIGFISMGIGIFSLFVEILATKQISACLIMFGIVSLLINSYGEVKSEYDAKGKELTKLFHEIKTLYNQVKSSSISEFENEVVLLKNMEERFSQIAISKQVLCSSWYAHYKFFWEMQIEWIYEQKKFKLFRDKIPLSFVFFVLIVSIFGFWLAHHKSAF
jgi:hypothetical protein